MPKPRRSCQRRWSLMHFVKSFLTNCQTPKSPRSAWVVQYTLRPLAEYAEIHRASSRTPKGENFTYLHQNPQNVAEKFTNFLIPVENLIEPLPYW